MCSACVVLFWGGMYDADTGTVFLWCDVMMSSLLLSWLDDGWLSSCWYAFLFSFVPITRAVPCRAARLP